MLGCEQRTVGEGFPVQHREHRHRRLSHVVSEFSNPDVRRRREHTDGHRRVHRRHLRLTEGSPVNVRIAARLKRLRGKGRAGLNPEPGARHAASAGISGQRSQPTPDIQNPVGAGLFHDLEGDLETVGLLDLVSPTDALPVGCSGLVEIVVVASPGGEVAGRLTALCEGEDDAVALMATLVCELHHADDRFDWTGVYRVVAPGLLKIGPYQGGHGCLTIPFGKGVCGTAAATGAVQLVPDVDAFPGHIACAASTRSELVLPVRNATGAIIAVFDLDSDRPDAFTQADAAGLGEQTLDVEVRSLASIARELGPGFAEAALRAPVGRWSGPVESAYGLHYVFVHARAPRETPPLDAVATRVRADLLHAREERALRDFLAGLRARADVRVERPAG